MSKLLNKRNRNRKKSSGKSSRYKKNRITRGFKLKCRRTEITKYVYNSCSNSNKYSNNNYRCSRNKKCSKKHSKRIMSMVNNSLW